MTETHSEKNSGKQISAVYLIVKFLFSFLMILPWQRKTWSLGESRNLFCHWSFSWISANVLKRKSKNISSSYISKRAVHNPINSFGFKTQRRVIEQEAVSNFPRHRVSITSSTYLLFIAFINVSLVYWRISKARTRIYWWFVFSIWQNAPEKHMSI